MGGGGQYAVTAGEKEKKRGGIRQSDDRKKIKGHKSNSFRRIDSAVGVKLKLLSGGRRGSNWGKKRDINRREKRV